MLMRIAVCGVLTTTVTATGPVMAQTRPDFSGAWSAVPEPAGTTSPRRPAPPVWGPQFTIDHKDPALTVVRTFSTAGPATIKYVLDGSETKSRMPGRLCEPDTGALWNALWDGSAVALTMVGAVPANGKQVKMDVKSTLRLESTDTLRVEVAASVARQTAPRMSSTLYRRTTAAPVADAPSVEGAKATIAQVGWIAGTWIGTSSSGTTTFEERWTPAAGGSMIAVARTLRDGNMSAFEFLCIVERNGTLVYQAMPNGRSPATDFALTKIDADTAIFENPGHDFPKSIRYTRRPDGSLEAVIGGDAKSKPQTFLFMKQN